MPYTLHIAGFPGSANNQVHGLVCQSPVIINRCNKSVANRMPEPLDELYRDANGTITICMHCGRTRRNLPGGTQWDLVEEYVARPPRGASHGLCPDCLEKHYPPRQT